MAGVVLALSTLNAQPTCREATLGMKGQGILDIQKWEREVRKQDILIIGVSDSQCSSCCQSEGILSDFEALSLKVKGKPLQVYRIDTSLPSSQAILAKEELVFDAVPRILVYKDGRFYSYDSGYDKMDLMIHFINRLQNPVLRLESEEEIVKFLALDGGQVEFWENDLKTPFMKQLAFRPDSYFDALQFQTRVICFVYDKQEYREEVNNVRRDARFLAGRENLRVAIVDNQRLVKKMKAGQNGPRLFSQVSMSSLVLRRYDGVLRVHDLTGEDHISIQSWINKNSLKEVQELTNESYRIQELTRQPMFIAFIDFTDPRYQKESYKAVEVLKEVAPKYSHILGFFYVNNTQFLPRKRVLGVTWDEVPSMAFNFMGDASRVMPYPRGREISKNALFDFFDDLFTGRSGVGDSLPSEYRPPSDFSKTKLDHDLENIFLNRTIKATRENFGKLVYQEGYDVLVLLYTSEVVQEGQRGVALQVNMAADALEKLQQAFPDQEIGTSTRIVSYDVNVNAFPDGIDFTMELPQIMFFPAYNKRPPFKRYAGQAAVAGPILEFIQKNSDVKFKYPVDVSRVGFPKDQPKQEQEFIQQPEL